MLKVDGGFDGNKSAIASNVTFRYLAHCDAVARSKARASSRDAYRRSVDVLRGS